MSNLVTIDKDGIGKLILKSKSVIDGNDVETRVVALIEARDELDRLIGQITDVAVAQAVAELGDDFTKVEGERLVLTKRLSGNKYQIVDRDAVPEEFWNEAKLLNTEKVDKHWDANQKLPAGLEFKDRKPSINLKLL